MVASAGQVSEQIMNSRKTVADRLEHARWPKLCANTVGSSPRLGSGTQGTLSLADPLSDPKQT